VSRFPFVHQQANSDCGIACLAMVCRYFGKDPSPGLLRDVTQTDDQGTTFLGMMKGAEFFGFSVQALKSEGIELPRTFPCPCIVHGISNDKSGFHFMVVWRIGISSYRIADPARGVRRLSKKDFLSFWSGGVIVFKPESNFLRERGLHGPLSPFFGLLGEFKARFSLAIMCSLAGTLGVMGQFVYFRYLLDEVIPGGLYTNLLSASLGAILMVLLQVSFFGLREVLLASVGNTIDFAVMSTYFRHLLSLPLEFYDRRRKGELLSRIEDAKYIRKVVSGTGLSLFLDTTLILGLGSFLLLTLPRLTLIALLSVPPSVATVLFFAPRFFKEYRTSLLLHGQSHAYVIETLDGIPTTKSLQFEERAASIGEDRFFRTVYQNLKLDNLATLQGTLIGGFEGTVRIAILGFGAYEILEGRLTLGQLISFQAVIGYLVGPLGNLLTLQPAVQGARAAARRLREILGLPREVLDSPVPAKPRPKGAGGRDIEMSGVQFSYLLKSPVLHNVDLYVPGGSRIGIVGSSGSGKSTLVKLLLGYYEIGSGTIKIGGVDLRDIGKKDLRSRIGYVPQEVWLFHGTILENLCAGVRYSWEEVVEACEKARILETIEHLPDRFQYLIEEGGKNLSGGERQRIGIARALLRNPQILIFDEATSALDNETQQGVLDSLKDLSDQGVTLLLVCHRLELAKTCDEIWVFDSGRVHERGTHQSLLASRGQYYALWSKGGIS